MTKNEVVWDGGVDKYEFLDFVDREHPDSSLSLAPTVQDHPFELLKKCMFLRKHYINPSLQNTVPEKATSMASKAEILHAELPPDLPLSKDNSFALGADGIFHSPNHTPPPTADIHQFYADLEFLMNCTADGPTKTLAFKRLKFLEAQFEMYRLMNDKRESSEQKAVPHRDFYNIYKNDAHVHHSACMNLKHLLSFIKRKIKNHPSDVVTWRDEKYLSLEEVFASLGIKAHELSIDSLNMHAHQDVFHRFDKFNLKYNPMGESRLREIFLKSDNLIKGRYLAELTAEVIHMLEKSKYQLAEYRISIYGRSADEWDKLATWVCDHGLFSPNIRWIIQLPRLFSVYHAQGVLESFQGMLHNFFQPLFEVTAQPSSNPNLYRFLLHVVGFDSVDDESKPEVRSFKRFPQPKDWNFAANPPYSYYLYHMYANITVLNAFRTERSMNTFALRPHSGEAGDTEHLAVAFLTSLNICHGVLLRKVPVLQYLYYLMQIGIAMSPLSNNSLFLTYDRNPFPDYLKRGLNVSLSTDDPLQFHFTREPLIEEYSVATQIYKLTPADLGELARNSVMQGGYAMPLKEHWLGTNCAMLGATWNDIRKTNIPVIRLAFRESTLKNERNMVFSNGKFIVVPIWNPIPDVEPESSEPVPREEEEGGDVDDSGCGSSVSSSPAPSFSSSSSFES